MATSTIISDNGVTSGTTGLKTAGGDDGTLVLQTTTAGGTATTAITIDTSQAVTFAQTANLPNTFGFKNRIINGDMRIDQRNAGASFALPNSTTSYTLDRWFAFENGSMAFSFQRSSTAPTSFTNSMLVTTTTGAVAGSNDRSQVCQRIEGFNIADLNWGTANAKTVTLSFWIRSSLTGQFGGSLQNVNADRSYPFSFTISAANTFEYKTITIAGDTTGTWATDSSTGIQLNFDLGMGSGLIGTAGAWAAADYRGATGDTKLSGTTGATMYITGVQLEVGSTATSFDYRDYGRELAMCQRYYYRLSLPSDGNRYCVGFNQSTTVGEGLVFFKTSMRTAPAALEQTGTASNYSILNQTTNVACSSVPTFSQATTENASFLFTVASGLTAGNGSMFRSNATNTYLAWSAEL